MNKRFVLTGAHLLLVFFLSGCGSLFAQPEPTQLPPEMIGTAIVLTQAAIESATAANAPSPTITPRPSRTPYPTETPRPTWTASITPSPTVTFVIVVPVYGSGGGATETPGGVHYPYEPLPGYQAANGCDLVALSPDWGTTFHPGDSFDAEWTFANYGPNTWGQHVVDFNFTGGELMHELGDQWDLPTTVSPGQRVTMIVDMVAPLSKGSFTSTWLLHWGEMFLCEVSVNIRVK